jgi:hypothetical protein
MNANSLPEGIRQSYISLMTHQRQLREKLEALLPNPVASAPVGSEERQRQQDINSLYQSLDSVGAGIDYFASDVRSNICKNCPPAAGGRIGRKSMRKSIRRTRRHR